MLMHLARRSRYFPLSDRPTVSAEDMGDPPTVWRSRVSTRPALILDDIITSLGSMATPNDRYPPYNLKRNENDYVLELAVAGISADRLEVKVEEDKLIVLCNDSEVVEEGWEYILNTMATRKFTREFHLQEDVEVTGSELKDGLLLIHLTKHVVEPFVRTIPIGTGKNNESNMALRKESLEQTGTDDKKS